MKQFIGSVLLTICVGALPAFAAADPCTAFKWDAWREVAVHRTTAESVTAGKASADAPAIQAERLYALALQPQESVNFVATPSKKQLADGASAGLLKLRVNQSGQYRIALDSGFWLDVVREGKTLDSLDFNGSAECASPRKIVVYELPAGVDLFVQASAASSPNAKLSVTRVVAKP